MPGAIHGKIAQRVNAAKVLALERVQHANGPKRTAAFQLKERPKPEPS